VILSLVNPVASFSVTAGASTLVRVRAIDAAGNASPWVAAPVIDASILEQTSPLIAYAGSWTTSAVSAASGGSVKFAKAAGASVTLPFTGRAVAFVATLAPDRGRAKVFVDGALATTIDLRSTTTTSKVIVFSRRWATAGPHSIRIVVEGTAGRPRVDVDAFVILK
jgi:hypothetical protein